MTPKFNKKLTAVKALLSRDRQELQYTDLVRAAGSPQMIDVAELQESVQVDEFQAATGGEERQISRGSGEPLSEPRPEVEEVA